MKMELLSRVVAAVVLAGVVVVLAGVVVVAVTSRRAPPLPASDAMEAIAREGKHHYEVITKESQMPRYGDCYQATLRDLHDGCSDLTDEVQSRLALAFTNCYVARFGWAVYPCGPKQPLAACMRHLDSRAASVYSAMLSNTLAMCHFLQAQAWHSATTHAVHSLQEASEKVSSQLSQAVDSAAALTLQMDTQITESRQALKHAFLEIRESTAEQRGLIIDVFDRVAELQSLLMGEFSWFYAVVFYVASVVTSLLATCTPRTLGARLPIMATLAASLLLERFLLSRILAQDNTHASQVTSASQADVELVVWIVRRLAATCSCLLLLHEAFSYRDPVAVTTSKLEQLAAATADIRKLIHSTPGLVKASSRSPVALSPVIEQSDSSDDIYDPDDDSDDYSDLEESPYVFGSLATPMIKEHGSSREGRYSLRPRPRGTVQENPLLAQETPESFARTIRHLEVLSRHRSRSQVWQFSALRYSKDLSQVSSED
ncbi:uncharacterized protein [Procambarus clarkii]|uniref:uncharacterized protein isoform X3 n=1 Tax=Procambarus clarkii TaxID=6728 RepID=UPI003742B94E